MACGCPIRPKMTYNELLEEIVRPRKYCTATGFYMCPTLDQELRRADKERSRQQSYEKRRKAKQ